MTAPNQPPAPGAADPLDAGALYSAVFAYVSIALRRMGCPDADRDDLAQRVVLKAYQRRHQYDDTRGPVGPWLWGIARNELRRSEHQRRRRPLLDLSASDARGDTPPLEDIVLLKDLADFVWKDVPEAEQRVIWEHVMGRSSFEEIAELQGISKSRALRLYNKGMDRLRAALKRANERRLTGAAVPFVFTELFDLGHGPPVSPEVLERGWQEMLVEMGRGDDGSDRCAPASDDDTPPSSQPGAPAGVLRRVLGPIAGVVIGALFAGPTLARCDHDSGREARPAAALAAVPATFVRGGAADGAEPSPAAYLASVANGAGMTVAPNVDDASGETEPADHRPAPGSDARLLDEWSLLKQGRAALATKDAAAAIVAVEQHARRFPNGKLAGLREGLRAQACARLRAATAGDAATIDKRCAGKP